MMEKHDIIYKFKASTAPSESLTLAPDGRKRVHFADDKGVKLVEYREFEVEEGERG
jgi:hypothetical protein